MKHLHNLICVLFCLCVGGAALAENRSIFQLDDDSGMRLQKKHCTNLPQNDIITWIYHQQKGGLPS